jgi:transposase-like protein
VSEDTHPRPGIDYPRNWHELLAWFPDDGACLRYLERLRWREEFVCRFCGAVGGGWWQMSDGLRRCAVCRSGTSVTAGTIFAGTRTPLVSWFAAVWYVVNQKQGVSALGLQRVLGLGSYRTAWSWLHKLRRGMVLPGRELLAEAVEVDESYIGGVRAGTGGRGARGKAIVAIAVEDRGVRAGRVRMRRIPNVTKDTLTEFVLDHIARGAEVHTDAWQGYNDIGRYRFQHMITNVSASGDPAHVALPHVHRVASLVQRWILGTHQGAVSHDQLDYYLDEFTFRFNRRHARHRGLLFYRLLEGALAADPHPYKTLTAESAA